MRQSNGPRYQWPASQLTSSEMEVLVRARERTGKPITVLLRDAIHKTYDEVGEAAAE